MIELFELPESKSPRLKWMERHHLRVNQVDADAFNVYHGMKYVCKGDSEEQALYNAAKKLNIKLWNEEGTV